MDCKVRKIPHHPDSDFTVVVDQRSDLYCYGPVLPLTRNLQHLFCNLSRVGEFVGSTAAGDATSAKDEEGRREGGRRSASEKKQLAAIATFR